MHVVVTDAVVELPPPKTPRSPGIHVSGIIRSMAMEYGILNQIWTSGLSMMDLREITDRTALLRISIGLAWEEYYIPTLPDVVDHPGELHVDGIYMSPDGESISVNFTGSLKHLVHEVKATYKSLNTVGENLRDQWMWLAQIKAYCKGLHTRFARLHVLFLCGDYSYPIIPVLKIYDIEFTQEEVDDNWSLLIDYMNSKTEGA